MLLTERIPATIEDYEKLPEKAPYQLIGGELVMSPSPTPFHQGILDNFVFALGTFVRANNLGRIFAAPLDVRFSDYDVFQPDLIFIRKEHMHLIGKEKLNIIPDLVIEILSPSNAYDDFTRKKAVYCEQGVAEYWIVDPENETIEVMVKDGEYYRTDALVRKDGSLQSPMFPGLSLKVEDVFAF